MIFLAHLVKIKGVEFGAVSDIHVDDVHEFADTACSLWITWPVATSGAANRVVVL